MLKNLLKTVKQNRSAAAALLVAIVLPVAFNNCSAKMSFEASQESRIAALNTSGAIVINNGDQFTTSKAVTLSLVHATADKMYVTNDPKCESGGTWEPMSNLKTWNLGSVNTTSAVYVKFSNDGVVASDCLNDTIIHDDIAPTLAVITAPPAFTNAADVAAVLLSNDAGSGVDSAICSGTSASAKCTPSNLTVMAAAEGSHSYTVSVKDRAGNVSPSGNVSFVVDRTVPTVALNLVPSSVSNQVSSEFRFSGTDALSGLDHFDCRSGLKATFGATTFKACLSGIIANSTSGPQRFEVRSVDRAGNMSAVASYEWLIDLGAPTVQITKTPGPFSNLTQASFEFVGTDDSGPLASFACSIDNKPATACSSPYTSPAGLTEGPHVFSVTGKDIAGNVSAPATYNWTVDTTPPNLAITAKPSAINSMKSADFVLLATDALSGIDSIECQIDGGGRERSRKQRIDRRFVFLENRYHETDTHADGPKSLDQRSRGFDCDGGHRCERRDGPTTRNDPV